MNEQDLIRVTERFTNPGYLDPPNLVVLDCKKDMTSLQKHLEGCGYVNVEVSSDSVAADISEHARDCAYLMLDMEEWFQENFPFCPQFIASEWDNTQHLATYIEDNRGDMTDDQVREWIHDYPDLSNYAQD